MKTGPKYKIARRLGAPIFEKTQSPKYALSLARKEKSRGRQKPKSEYGLQLLEKQKARFSYGLSEKQFRTYIYKALTSDQPVQKLFSLLETRLDNVLYRAGFLKTRAQAKQAASHGHFVLKGLRVTIPSIQLKAGDSVAIREGSVSSALFTDVAERMGAMTIPAWIKVDVEKRTATVEGEPVYVPGEQVFDLGLVIEFYNR
jgi:small subunit ribosomal protein S4